MVIRCDNLWNTLWSPSI